ncbi:hypothetical protein SYNPS1DRAFT_26630 [Syncephalis pseudoplumigaleata]|uniref:Uncharacterized protein n=1 Tax=Syncephalis pseudoplumigaleata TaxID=1712513 RepID=A0A4P9Z7N2_9FUNG|nr:hypothetical protein SYNPS1DRAFT_26630 [Syncephalis pseudoplumigaleata]|eukprot:RKP27730.1 hypothetical protein SYNPS1DRAFT_26630 [Syncephalis pseudoplumigaleata]
MSDAIDIPNGDGQRDSGSGASGASLVGAAMDILRQCQQMLEAVPDDDTYTAISRNVPGSTIGKHVRHLCDHFRLLFEGLEGSASSTKEHTRILVEYDRRNARCRCGPHGAASYGSAHIMQCITMR